MSLKPTPQKISQIVQRYIDKYQSETVKKDEYIYQLPTSECGELGDFLRDDAGRAYLCFYPLSNEKYDDEHNEFMTAQFFPPNYLGLKDNKIKLGLNVVIPTRNGYVDKAQVVEIIAHELNHAYTTWHEIQQKHVSNPIGIIAAVADIFKSKKHKYTYSEKQKKYDDIMPSNSGSLRDDFRWVGYFGVRTEINANLAGIDAFLYEHNGKTSKLSQSRGYQTYKIVRKKFEKLKQSATDSDWEWAMKNATYIYQRKNETVSQFKNRYIKYYENIFNEFNNKVEKIINKYKNKSDKFKSGRTNILSKNAPKIYTPEKTK